MLSQRVALYLSPPLTPLPLGELPARLSFRACPRCEWEIGPARIHAAPVAHPGPTHDYRIGKGDISVNEIGGTQPVEPATWAEA